MRVSLKQLAVAAAIALTVLPLLIHPVTILSESRMPLFTPASMLSSLGVYALLVIGAASGIAKKGNALIAVLFACALVGAIFDARIAAVFAVIAAPLMLERRTT